MILATSSLALCDRIWEKGFYTHKNAIITMKTHVTFIMWLSYCNKLNFALTYIYTG